jgi:CsoR family transcriptional regulator, copper-sensing transcriptional repressor
MKAYIPYGVYMDEHRKKVLNRLRRIEGQIRGLERMVEQEAPCADVLTQLYAATAAMKKTGLVIIQANMRRCIREAADDPDKTIDDFQNALTRFIGMS